MNDLEALTRVDRQEQDRANARLRTDLLRRLTLALSFARFIGRLPFLFDRCEFERQMWCTALDRYDQQSVSYFFGLDHQR